MLTLVKTLPDGPPEFDEFWTSYPKKEGKKYAKKCWDRLTAGEQKAAITALPNHVKKWKFEGRDRQFIPDCSSWLNQARFEDEIDLSPWFVSHGSHAAVKQREDIDRGEMPDSVRQAIARLKR